MTTTLPERLIIFVTTKCNLACKHCFYAYSLNNRTHDLRPEDMKRILDNYPRGMKHVIITGGEPFLNKDITEVICNIKAKSTAIVTNGGNPKRIIEAAEDMLHRAANIKTISISISLDGPEHIHNLIRGRSDSYRKAIETFRGLKELEKKHSRFRCGVGAALSRMNIGHLDAMENFVRNELGEEFALQMVRSVEHSNLPQELRVDAMPSDSNETIPDDFPDEVIRNLGAINSIMRRNIFAPSTRTATATGRLLKPLKSLSTYLQTIGRWKAQLKTIKEKRRIFECRAGESVAVVYPNLDVSLCEFMKPLGNLSDVDFDLNALWNGDRCNELREVVAKCFCTHTCFVAFPKYDIRKFTYWLTKC